MKRKEAGLTCASFAATRILKTDTRRTSCIETERSVKMKDKNGIEICCENCRCVCKYDSMCLAHTPPSFFRPTSEALEARIAELQKELNIVQEPERKEARDD